MRTTVSMLGVENMWDRRDARAGLHVGVKIKGIGMIRRSIHVVAKRFLEVRIKIRVIARNHAGGEWICRRLDEQNVIREVEALTAITVIVGCGLLRRTGMTVAVANREDRGKWRCCRSGV